MANTDLQKWLAYMKKTPPGSVPKPYPEPTGGDVGKVLSVDENGNPIWVEPGKGLPEITESDRDKVLVVDSNGVPTWGNTVSGDIPLGDNESIGIFKE